jgi:hypothetical protein
LIDIRRDYTVPSGATALTLVAKLACGNRDPSMELLRLAVRWPQSPNASHQFALGVDGEDGSPELGRFTRGADGSNTMDMFGTRTVSVALARKDIPGPQHTGEFFNVRLVLRNNGSMSAWLNEDPASLWTGNAYPGVGTSFVKINPDEQSGTMWLDRIRLMEGEVAPSACGDPVFDVNDDWRVDAGDLANGQNGLLDCMTGPAPAAAVFDALSARCKCHDVNHDSATDMNDFAAFQRCIAMGDIAADPTCDN